jgi:hypothetical protein
LKEKSENISKSNPELNVIKKSRKKIRKRDILLYLPEKEEHINDNVIIEAKNQM